MTPTEQNELITAACEARQQAYANYSQYQVGAAVRTRSGMIFRGCNVENRSYGLTVCAEQVAVTTAVTAGHRELTAIAIATQNGAAPCGACRQILAEFAAEMSVLLVTDQQPPEVRRVGLSELLPKPFTERPLS